MRLGIIIISDIFVEKQWENVYPMFEHFKPIKIERNLFSGNRWEFYGKSKFFDDLIEGECAPQYEVISYRKMGKLLYKFNRVDGN